MEAPGTYTVRGRMEEEEDAALARALHMSVVVAQHACKREEREAMAALAAELVAEQPDKELGFFDMVVREGVTEPRGSTFLSFMSTWMKCMHSLMMISPS